MKRGLIITLPSYEEVTNYLYYFSKEILEEAKNNNIPLRKIEYAQVTRKNFESNLASLDYNMIIFNGHGGPDCIEGHKGEIIIQSNVNHHLLKGRITYARACWSASDLGIKSIQDNKEGCFIGYSIPFMFLADPTREITPNKDKVARYFLEPSNLVPISLIKGNTALEAHIKSKNSILKNIKKILTKKEDVDSSMMVETLWNNYFAQELIGDGSMTL